jgi:hypothetical protein
MGIEFSNTTVIAAEGARIGLMTCKECGTALLLDPRETEIDVVKVHKEWHRHNRADPHSVFIGG